LITRVVLEKGAQTPSMTVECLRTGNDKIAAIVNRLCTFLEIALSKTQGTLINIVLVVLGLLMLRKHYCHSIVGLLALAFATCLFARGQFWHFLGYTQVDSSQNHGRIQITRRDLHFRTIQLRVSGEAIFFDRLVVHFDDGTSKELMVSDRISPGGRNFDLLREDSLVSVELWYYKEPWGHNPTVSVYGIHLPDPDAQAMAREH
jgi:hypothetical protein